MQTTAVNKCADDGFSHTTNGFALTPVSVWYAPFIRQWANTMLVTLSKSW